MTRKIAKGHSRISFFFFFQYPLEKKYQLGAIDSAFVKASRLLQFLSDVEINQSKIFQTYF